MNSSAWVSHTEERVTSGRACPHLRSDPDELFGGLRRRPDAGNQPASWAQVETHRLPEGHPVSRRPRRTSAFVAALAAVGIALGLGLTASSNSTAMRSSHATQLAPPGTKGSATPESPTIAPPPPPPTTTTVPPPPAPAVTSPPASNGIPQSNGGDQDPDNNGGPDDHDGDT